MRSKRSTALRKTTPEHIPRINQLQIFKKDRTNIGTDYSEEELINDNYNGQQEATRNLEQNNESSFIDFEDYQDFAFDTTDTEQFHEDNDLLHCHHGHSMRRDTSNDFQSFTDLMRMAAANSILGDTPEKRLHYGNDVFQNDNGIYEENKDSLSITYDKYDSYDDY